MTSNLDQADQPTRFVGREIELSETRQILQNADCRLLTLVGIGGSGKTRLAIQLAKDPQQPFAYGAWFVNLQPIQSGPEIATVIAASIADAMGVVLSGHDTSQRQLLHYLRDKNLLLLLDNFEHVLDGTVLLAEIMQQAPAVKLLVTSRAALSLPQEWLYPVEGLPFPASYQGDHQDQGIEASAAVRLFVERARQIVPGFSLHDNQAAVVQICQLVDGLPLAIEMAASWTKTLRCSEIAAEIRHNLNQLTSTLRHVPRRHSSMQAVLAQTWEHLTASEQGLFMRLAIFRGGFAREAAEEIAGASLSLLASLLDKCLIRRTPDSRYQIHELLRQFAESKLHAAEVAALAAAHCRYYCEYLAARNLGLIEREQVKNCLQVEEELENIRTAWQYAVAQGEAEILKLAAAPYFHFCQMQSRYLEYADAAGQGAEVLAAAGDFGGLAQVLVYRAWMLIRIGRFDAAAEALRASSATFDELGLVPKYGMGSHPLAPFIILSIIQGDYTRAVAQGEQLKHAMAGDADRENLGFACYGLTSAYLNLGQYTAALDNAKEALRILAEIGNHWMSAYCHIELGNVYQATGHYAEAERHYRAGLSIKRDYRDPEGVAVTAQHLGEIDLLQGDHGAARQLYEQSLSVYRNLNDQGGLAAAHYGLGQVAAEAGDPAAAAAHFRDALDIAGSINFLPLLLAVLTDVGVLLLANDRRPRGTELLRLVHDHPASSRRQQQKAAALLADHGAKPGEQAGESHDEQYNENHSSTPPAPPVAPEAILADLRAELLGFVPTASSVRAPVSAHAPAPASVIVPASVRSTTNSVLVEPLTEREREVLRLLVQGLSNPAIAQQLIISVGTVKTYTNRIYGKLSVTNRVEAVTKARDLGLV
jgi:predicted ATPase/DNA-binding CsgD family transcriptional regulator